MSILYRIIFLFAALRISCSIAQSHSTSGKARIIRNPSHVINGPKEYARALRKYNIASTYPNDITRDESNVPYHLHHRANIGDVNASLIFSQEFNLSPVTVGEGDSAKTFFVILDTGSSDFWLFSNLINNKTGLSIHTVYEPLNSSSAVMTGQTWSIQYGIGSAEGIVFNDTITFGGFVIDNQAVEAAVKVDPNIFFTPDAPADGIMGLAPFSQPLTIQPGNASSVLQNLFINIVEHPMNAIFTASLTRPNEPEGFFTFGSIDDKLVGNNTIIFTPVINDFGFWQVPSPFISVNGKKIDRPNNTAIVDTGTTFILLSDDLLPAIYKPLGGIFNTIIQSWVFPANFTDSQLPTIVLPVGNHQVTLAKRDIIFGQIDENWIMGSIQSGGEFTSSGLYIYGDFWLRNVYAIFDLADGENFRFGFVRREIDVNNPK